ncbi:hypothetical protein BGX28_009748, partial [Mortierella sp. GBA30]
ACEIFVRALARLSPVGRIKAQADERSSLSLQNESYENKNEVVYGATPKLREERRSKDLQELERYPARLQTREIIELSFNGRSVYRAELQRTQRVSSVPIILKDLVEITEKTSSTQKNSAAMLKKQKDELEAENNRMQKSLKEKEEALHYAMARLSAKEVDLLRYRSDQEVIKQLRKRLTEEIAKNKAMARTLELMKSEKLQQKVEDIENLRVGYDVCRNIVSNDDGEVPVRTLESESANLDPVFRDGENLDGITHGSAELYLRNEQAQLLLEESRRWRQSSIQTSGHRVNEGRVKIPWQKSLIKKLRSTHDVHGRDISGDIQGWAENELLPRYEAKNTVQIEALNRYKEEVWQGGE